MVVAGIFVGGRGLRMGGVRKETLRAPSGETLHERWRAIFASLGMEAIDVGGSGLVDEGRDAGPLGGVAALLAWAGKREAITVACDMPFVTEAMIARLMQAPVKRVVAARREGRWEPFFAKWHPSALPTVRANVARGALSLQRTIDEVGGEEFALDREDSQRLFDWDEPGDVLRTPGSP